MSDEDFSKRWQKVLSEIERGAECDFTIVNKENELSQTVEQAKNIILQASLD